MCPKIFTNYHGKVTTLSTPSPYNLQHIITHGKINNNKY